MLGGMDKIWPDGGTGRRNGLTNTLETWINKQSAGKIRRALRPWGFDFPSG